MFKKSAALAILAGGAIAIAGCGSTGSSVASHSSNGASSDVATGAPVAQTTPATASDPKTCDQGHSDIQTFGTDVQSYLNQVSNGDASADPSQVQSDLTSVENDLQTLAGEATSSLDQSHLADDRQALGHFTVGIDDIQNQDYTDGVQEIDAGVAGIAGYGTQTLAICS